MQSWCQPPQAGCTAPAGGLTMQVSMKALETADQVQQKSKRITENVRHQVKHFLSAQHKALAMRRSSTDNLLQSQGLSKLRGLVHVLQWDEVDQKFKVTEHASVAMMVSCVLQWLHVRLLPHGPGTTSNSSCVVPRPPKYLLLCTCRMQEKQLRLCSPRSTVLPSSNTPKRLRMRGYADMLLVN